MTKGLESVNLLKIDFRAAQIKKLPIRATLGMMV